MSLSGGWGPSARAVPTLIRDVRGALTDTWHGGMSEMAGQRFHRGAPVYDVVGATVGRLHVFDPEGGYITARHGVLFHRDAYIPLDAIRITDA